MALTLKDNWQDTLTALHDADDGSVVISKLGENGVCAISIDKDSLPMLAEWLKEIVDLPYKHGQDFGAAESE